MISCCGPTSGQKYCRIAEIVHFTHLQAVLHHSEYGSGPRAMLLFHGYGQDRTVFERHLSNLEKEYRFYSFDLFFHGKSVWPFGDTPLEKQQWKQLLGSWLHERKIDSFSVLGFSMGGKFALATFEMFAGQVSELFLIAPDGIRLNPWYRLATFPWLTRKVFKSMIDHHERFIHLIRVAQTLRMVDRGVLRFVETQMNTAEQRSRVYYSWVVFRHLEFDLKTLARLAQEHHVTVRAWVGKHDKLITEATVSRFTRLLPQAKLDVLHTGHNGVMAMAFESMRTK